MYKKTNSWIDFWKKTDIMKMWIKRNAPPRVLSPSKNREFFLFAGMMELVDMRDLGSRAHALGFESPCPHHKNGGERMVHRRFCMKGSAGRDPSLHFVQSTKLHGGLPPLPMPQRGMLHFILSIDERTMKCYTQLEVITWVFWNVPVEHLYGKGLPATHRKGFYGWMRLEKTSSMQRFPEAETACMK